MKIITLSGEDTTKSYERLQKFVDEAKRRSMEIEHFIDPKSNIFERLGSQSLFLEKRLFVVGDAKILSKKDLEKIKRFDDAGLTLILFFDKELTPAQKKQLLEIGKVEEFPVPKIIWTFLDSFYPGNSKKVINLLHQLYEQQPLEVIMVLLVRHIRDLVWVQTNNPPNYPSWRIGKLKGQAKRYKEGELELVIEELSKVDYQSKIGMIDPIIALDFLIGEKLQ